MLRLAIIADDLTGALDAAAPFAGRGLRTKVALSPDDIALDAEVVAISTRSREIAPEAARAAVARALAALPPGTRLMKKIDSRMKGNIAVELSAFPLGRVLLAPAIPDFGRVTLNGHVTGFGVDTPVPATIAGVECIVPDVATPEQMRDALAAAGDALPVGARGLAEAMAAAMSDQQARPAQVGGPVGVFVIGSRDPITTAQVAAMRRPVLHAPNGMVPSLPQGTVVIQAVQGEQAAAPAQVAANLAQGLRGITADTLFITGGATAEAVLTALGITTMDLLGECLPGLPVARAGGMTIVTKSGGFGTVDTLAELASRIERAA